MKHSQVACVTSQGRESGKAVGQVAHEGQKTREENVQNDPTSAPKRKPRPQGTIKLYLASKLKKTVWWMTPMMLGMKVTRNQLTAQIVFALFATCANTPKLLRLSRSIMEFILRRPPPLIKMPHRQLRLLQTSLRAVAGLQLRNVLQPNFAAQADTLRPHRQDNGHMKS